MGRPAVPVLFALAALMFAIPAPIGSSGHVAPGSPHASYAAADAGLHRILYNPPRHIPYAALRPHALSVNPYAIYSSEPAPMGLTDFGVDQNGVTYSYSTNEFLGIANFTKLKFNNPSLGSSQYQGTLQQNVVLDFTAGGVLYNYWIQNVLFVDTSANQVTFENNIWNLTSGNSAGMLSSSVSGNGQVYPSSQGGWYAYGNGIYDTLTYPATLKFIVNSTVNFGVPRVTFSYNDGVSGWITYDTVDFFATGVPSARFTVDGSGYIDGGLFSDAELVFGGPGGGSYTTMTSAKLGLSMQFFNGHNLQEVPNAFDFGSDTAEAISNVSGALGDHGGYLYSSIAASSSGALNLVYDRSYAAIFNGTTRFQTGTYIVNNVSQGAYVGGEVNLTLGPGNYQIQIAQNGTIYETADIVLSPGEYLAYNFNPGSTFVATFHEHGLPAGTAWRVQVGTFEGSSSGTTLNVVLPNGTFNYLVQVVPGYDATPRAGLVTISGANVSVANISWTIHLYLQYFQETGLPSGTPWEITFNGTDYPSTFNQFSLSLPNGTYYWSLWGIAGYRGAPVAGLVNITGSTTPLVIHFAQRVYTIVFHEVGLPASNEAAWQIAVNGAPFSGAGGFIDLTVPNGSYAYSVPVVGSYDPSPALGTVVVAGQTSSVVVTYTPEPARVSVTVTPGNATVAVDGLTVSANLSGSYLLTLPPGTYLLTFSAPGYESTNQSVTVVPGEALTVGPVHLKPTAPPIQPTHHNNATGGLAPWVEYGLIAGILVAVIALAAVALRRRAPAPPNRP